jgi:hypothetical protein
MQSDDNVVQKCLYANPASETKRCLTCGADKLFDAFARKGSSRCGVGSVAARCKHCVNLAGRSKRALTSKKISVEERFWSKVDKNGPVPSHRPELGQCWI